MTVEYPTGTDYEAASRYRNELSKLGRARLYGENDTTYAELDVRIGPPRRANVCVS